MSNQVRLQIKAKVEKEADQITWHELQLGFDQGQHKTLLDQKGLTDDGFILFLDILANTISYLARDAGETGYNEGAIIGAIIKQLEDNLVSIELWTQNPAKVED